MPREELPSRRAADVVSFDYEGKTWSATFGRFPDGRLGEVFIHAPEYFPPRGDGARGSDPDLARVAVRLPAGDAQARARRP